jgi:hypothetical protein
MQRVRKKQLRIGGFRLAGGEHGPLPAAVGVPASEYRAFRKRPHRSRRRQKSIPVAGGVAGAGRTGRALLAEGQIAAER